MWLLLSHIACSKFSFKILTNLKPWWQKLCEGTKGVRQKVWPRTKILNPNIRYIVAILWFVTIYALFGRLFTYILHSKYFISYWIEFAICNNAQKRLICRDNSKYAPAKTFVAIFTLAGRLPTFATLSQAQKLNQTSASKSWPNFSFEDLTRIQPQTFDL